MQEIGLLCGTFNPIHLGHLLIAECASCQYKLQKVLFITSGAPPHRSADLLDKETRFRIVQAAIAGNPRFEASRVELDRAGSSYTVDTLRDLRAEYGSGTRLNLIVGADNVPYISQWHEAGELLKLCRLLVAPRIASTTDNSHKLDHSAKASLEGADLSPIICPIVSISSSDIRKRLQRQESVLYMVPPAVNHILISEKLCQGQPRVENK